MNKEPISIAILGTRGIPNRYGGFETCAEKLGLALVEAGYKVAVYCGREHEVKETEWNGIRRIMIHNPEKKLGTFAQFIYDLNCNLHSRKQDFDIVLHLGYTSDSVGYRFWSRKSIHFVNMDGMEWKREKYGKLTRRFLKYAERLATIRAHTLVADNPAIEDYLNKKYTNAVVQIPYGAEAFGSFEEAHLKDHRLEKHKYDLMVARMEPENNIEDAIQAKLESKDPTPLAIISNENNYKDKLRKKYLHETGIRFLHPVYDTIALSSIRHYARYYIHGHSVGGTNPSLLEAMACQCNIIAHGNPYNRAVLSDHSLFFTDKKELSEIFSKQPAHKFVSWKEINIKKVMDTYNWTEVSSSYEQLFTNAIDHT